MASVKNYEEEVFFQYPVNMSQIELASLILMYRGRGEVIKASPSSFLCCALENRLIKQAKSWFGKVYSQEAWDRMLSPDALGYPLTPLELHILGYASQTQGNQTYTRDVVDRYLDLPPSFGYVLINDLISFGFLQANDNYLLITELGEKAMNGLSRRLYKKRYKQDMLPHISGHILPVYHKSPKKSVNDKEGKSQASLF